MYSWTKARVSLFAVSLSPCLYFIYGLFIEELLWGNPIEYVTHQSGHISLLFLGLTLMIKPAQDLFGWMALIHYRRQLGLFSCFYAILHALVYFGLDLGFYWEEIVIDVIEHPYVWVGMIAILFFVVLAITSTQGWRIRLKKKWQSLHNWVYILPVLGILHFFLLVKADWSEPLLFASVFIVLLSWRLLNKAKRRAFRLL